MRRLVWLAVAVLLVMGSVAAPTTAAQWPGSGQGVSGPTTWVDHGIRINGSCVNSSPVLSLAPGQYAVSASVKSADASTCDVTWQIDAATTTRLATPVRPADGSSVEERAKVVVAAPAATGSGGVSPAATYSGSGYERAWFEDVVGLELNEVKSNISFSYNGSCVTSASGSGYWWWRSGTGWESPTNRGSWISTSCNNSKVWSQADYRNTGFCWPYTSNTHFRGVTVQGRYNGYLYGWVDNWWWNACLPFSFHSQLVRVTG